MLYALISTEDYENVPADPQKLFIQINKSAAGT